ncbi:hypothetical protein DIZ27_07965 [Streptomyces sp. NWU339]|uniref:hypothetical protein n=1 Tax=Streptomyces sp. NWU339 TaxID=2185284 RepID=UPI000D6759B7|nr:hypothetical protein [Streptomyces sp. NWU339]PWI11299.1 hypothetical protein DIZ27_07965 [Streptomyces sp. NWU339]
MLTSVPTGWLWLLAAASTVLSSYVLGSWIPLRKFRIAYPVIMVTCGAVLVVVCRLKGFSLAEALVMYSCAHISLPLGLLPQRKVLKEGHERWRRGEAVGPIEVPRRHAAFFAVCLVGVLFAGFALTR